MSHNNLLQILPLYAIVDGNPLSSTFEVDIATCQTVDDLKHAVKIAVSENRDYTNILGSIEVESLILWYAVVPHCHLHMEDKNSGQRVVQLDALRTKYKIRLNDNIGQVFGGDNYNPPEGMTYIVIELKD
ncbi:hypothetical protein BGZ95_009909 [Linnemannia exigua]|uniref:Crinkler effector protein N-terminal domain-containing protein n=1 Tax=Linnemannia exigua TaxID=604196 RepID=A0AAD4H5C7_9FUNG|nr:hypothetical protein BGZ95_009909 [Linnemannia exigua]